MAADSHFLASRHTQIEVNGGARCRERADVVEADRVCEGFFGLAGGQESVDTDGQEAFDIGRLVGCTKDALQRQLSGLIVTVGCSELAPARSEGRRRAALTCWWIWRRAF